MMLCCYANVTAQEISITAEEIKKPGTTGEKISFSPDKIRFFLYMHSDLSNPVTSYSTVNKEDALAKKILAIKEQARLLRDSLELVYINFYSEKYGQWWNDDEIQDYYQLRAEVERMQTLPRDEIDLEIQHDPGVEQCRTAGISLGNGIWYNSSMEKTIVSKELKLIDKNSSIKTCKISARVKYLTGFDTIAKLDKNAIGKEFEIDRVKYKVKNIQPGLIYLKPLTDTQDQKIYGEIKFLAYKGQSIIYPEQAGRYPSDFLSQFSGFSGYFNDSLVKLSKLAYENYLKNLKFSKGENKTDQIILKTGVDHDQILLLKPRYEYFVKTLKKPRVIKENVDNLQTYEVRESLLFDSN